MYTILEDCRPYYIRFTFSNLQNIINFVTSCTTQLIKQNIGYKHEQYNLIDSKKIISMLPMSKIFDFNVDRVALFNTPPGGGSSIHKDGIDNKISFNISIQVMDSECQTNWYSDSEFEHKLKIDRDGYSRIIWNNWRSIDKFTPEKTMSLKQNEMILFNIDIYHCWTNSKSKNSRKILTLRLVDRTVDFHRACNLLFGN